MGLHAIKKGSGQQNKEYSECNEMGNIFFNFICN